jgi:hypothetical protein
MFWQMENKESISINDIIEGKIEFNFGYVQQALLNRNHEPLSTKEAGELLKIMKIHYVNTLEKLTDPEEYKVRKKQIEQTIENIKNPFYWNYNTPIKTPSSDSIRHFCLASSEILENILHEKSKPLEENEQNEQTDSDDPIEYLESKIRMPLNPKKCSFSQVETAIFFSTFNGIKGN